MKKILVIVIAVLSFPALIKAQTFNPILAGKLQNKIDSIRTANNLKGISACIIYPGVGTWKGVTGISHGGFTITPEMEFGIGSNTKLFTGVLLLKLAENNLINLNDSLYKYLPNYTNVNPNITIRQLLNHTSGLADVNDVIGYTDSILTNPNRIYLPSEVMTWVGPPLFPAGTGWNYSNTNYILAGMIAESVTGKKYGKLLHDSILSPLKLDSTFLGVYDTILYTIAHPWQLGVDKFSTPRKALNSVAWSAGAMYSTSGEMAQWYKALMNGKILKSTSFGEMTTFVGSGNYGVGLYSASVLGRTVWHHTGTIWGGYNSSMVYDTTSGIVISVLINQIPAQPFQVSTLLLSTLLNNSIGIPENSPNSEELRLYPNPANGTVNIRLPNQNLQTVEVYNSIGQLMVVTPEHQFSISNFPNGVYTVKVKTDKGTIRYKIIKQ